MKKLFRVIAVLLLLTGCSQSRQPFNEDRKMILENIDTSLRGLTNGNVDEASIDLKSGNAYMIGNGKVYKITRTEYIKGFADQFKEGKYTVARKLDEPIIVFSDDGSMAWYTGTFQFQFSYKDSLGNMRTNKFNDALLCILEKKNNDWSLVAQAETYSKEE